MELRDSAPPLSLADTRPIAGVKPVRMSDLTLELVDRYRRWLLLGVFVVYLLGFNAQWRIDRDSALYLTIGRNLAEGNGFTFRGQDPVAYPGLPLFFAGTCRLFHTQSLVPALTLMFAMGGAALALTYRLFLLYAGRPTAVTITAGVALTRLFYRYCFELLSDLPFLLGVMAFLAGYEAIFCQCRAFEQSPDHLSPLRKARGLDWTFLVMGFVLAVAMRPTMWALLFAVAIALSFLAIRGQINWLIIVGAVVVIAATAVFYHGSWRAGAAGMDGYEGYIFDKLQHRGQLFKQIRDNVYDLFEATLIKALLGISLLKWLNSVVGVLVLALGLSLFRDRLLWGLWILFTVAMLLLFKPVDRYFLPVIPLLVYGWWRFLSWLNYLIDAKWSNLIFLVLFFGGLGTNIARIGEMIVEQRRRPFLTHYRESRVEGSSGATRVISRYESANRVAKLVKEKVKPDELVLSERKVARVMTFLSHRNVFEPGEALPQYPTFALLGQSWEEGKESRTDELDPVREWLAKNNMELGAAVAPPIQGKLEREPWTLYVVQKKR